MATYKGTVTSADVSGTHSDFPIYVNLTAIGTLTQAEADSIRVYSDAALTTELPREIVSTEEMHFKSSSLSGGDNYYVTVDGTSSDYATTATYGAENVWNSNYALVSHDGGDNDSTSNNNDGTANGSLPTVVTGKIGDANDFDGTGDRFVIGDQTEFNQDDLTISAWFKTSTDATMQLVNKTETSTPQYEWWMRIQSQRMDAQQSSASGGTAHLSVDASTDIVDGTYHYAVAAFDGNNRADIYVDGSVDGSDTTSSGTPYHGTSDVATGARSNGGQEFTGELDEVRVLKTTLSANWITTEYNNQNDPATFWTWEEVAQTPTVETDAATDIDSNSADLNGEITDIGGSDVTERGFVYGKTSQSDPGNTAPVDTDYTNSVFESGTFGTGVFSSNDVSLDFDTTYYFRAYAENSDGYSYGDELSFSTLAIPYEISGTVTLNGNAVENATIRCIRQSVNTAVASQTTDVNGAYLFENLDGDEDYHLAVEYETGGEKYNALSLWDITPIDAS